MAANHYRVKITRRCRVHGLTSEIGELVSVDAEGAGNLVFGLRGEFVKPDDRERLLTELRRDAERALSAGGRRS